MGLHYLLCGDPLIPADLEELGPIGAAIFEVDPLGVPDNLTLALTNCCQPGHFWSHEDRSPNIGLQHLGRT